MTKLKDAMSASKSNEVKIKGRVFNVGQFSLDSIIQLEEKGISLNDIGKHLNDKPVTYSTYFLWILLSDEDKKDFDNNIDTFRKWAGIEDLKSISDAVGKAFETSYTQGEEKKTEGTAA